jgi:hypothetical protein
MSSPKKKDIQDELWRRGVLSWKFHGVQKELYKKFLESEKHSISVWLLARQSGKCLPSETLVATPTGPVKIRDLKPGHKVIGYNKDGSLKPCNVVVSEPQGMKEVFDLSSRGVNWAASTDDHRWCTFNTSNKKEDELRLRDFKTKKHIKIVRKFYNAELGSVNNPHAYSLGALLGDGCSKQNGNGIYISSENDIIPKKIQKELNVKYLRKNSGINYTWFLSNSEKNKKSDEIFCQHYDEFCKDRYAHEKTIDMEIVKSWNRSSLLSFVAGLVDTEGSVYITGRRKNELKFSISMQAQGVMEAVEYAFLALWQIPLSYSLDNREKYKNGPCHTLYCNNNLHVKRFLKELDPHLVNEKKKWKPEYENFVNYNMKEDYIGFQSSEGRLTETHDIQIDNDTSFYMLANGLVTHNSFMMTALALEQALREKNSIVKLVTDTKLHVKNIYEPLFTQLLEDCPEDIKPQYSPTAFTYYFGNGSQIQLAGTDNKHYEKLRGQKSALVLVDEAGFCNDLEKVVRSVLLPTTTHTGGKIVLASTPPEISDHEFLQFLEESELNKTLTIKTIDDNPLLSRETIATIEKQMGGRTSEKFRREYLCEIIRDSSTTVVPEFTQELEQAIVKEWVKPPHYDAYVSMDLGGKDLTAVLFAYYDFRTDKIIIEDEIGMDFRQKHNNIPLLSTKIIEKEETLWYNHLTNEVRPPKLRVSDINYIVTQEMLRVSQNRLTFVATKKDDKVASINNLRELLQSEKIIISPKCQTLIRHLRNVRWKSANDKTVFARSADDSHFDFVDAALYLIRSMDLNRNPYPKGYEYNLRKEDTFIVPNSGNTGVKATQPQNVKEKDVNIYKKLFGLKR